MLSLLFNGLPIEEVRVSSCSSRENGKLEPMTSSFRSMAGLFPPDSSILSWHGLTLRHLCRSGLLFERAGDDPAELPWSLEMLSAVLLGLSGDVLDLDEVRTPAERRAVTRLIFALGGNGTAKGDGIRRGVLAKAAAEEGLGGDSGEGDGDFDVTRWKVCDRDGDLERERRKDRMALVVSG
jgi:hypothetical protein